jgi:hypothetical protein
MVFAIVALTFGCSSSIPSESDGRQYFETKGAEKNIFKVTSFKKTNGQGDDKKYTIDYEAEFQCLKPSTEPGTIGVAQHPFPDCDSAGLVVKQKGTLTFVKTEQGWRVDGWSMKY